MGFVINTALTLQPSYTIIRIASARSAKRSIVQLFEVPVRGPSSPDNEVSACKNSPWLDTHGFVYIGPTYLTERYMSILLDPKTRRLLLTFSKCLIQFARFPGTFWCRFVLNTCVKSTVMKCITQWRQKSSVGPTGSDIMKLWTVKLSGLGFCDILYF